MLDPALAARPTDDIPQQSRGIIRTRSQELATGRKDEGMDSTQMARKASALLVGRYLP